MANRAQSTEAQAQATLFPLVPPDPMPQFTPVVLIQWLFTWLILNWGASLALGRPEGDNAGLEPPRRRRTLASQQPKFIMHALHHARAVD